MSLVQQMDVLIQDMKYRILPMASTASANCSIFDINLPFIQPVYRLIGAAITQNLPLT